MDNMRGLRRVLISTLWALIFSAIVTSKTIQAEKNHLPIEILLNPLKSMDKLKGSNYDVIKKENKEVQLKIQSDDCDEGKVDLIIAATKEVQSENSIDKISPKYTEEQKVDNEKSYSNRQGDNIYSKTLQTSRQNPSTIYQPSDFSVPDPFTSGQKASELSQHYQFDKNPFSPLENLRHFEDNLQKEMHPRLLEQTLSTLQYANNESPHRMIATQPMYSNIYAPVFEMNSQFQPDPKSVQGVMPQQNPRQFYDLGTPQQMQITPNVPMSKYPLPIERPLRNSAVNPYYSYLNPVFKSTYPDLQPQFYIREMSRDPRYNAESGLISISPERQVLPHSPGKPEYTIHDNSQHPLMNTHKEQLPQRNNIDINHHSYHLPPQNQRIPVDHNNPHSNGHHQLKNEVHDRNLYYTPLADNRHKHELRDPNYPSSVNQHLHRLRIIPTEEHYEPQAANKHPNLNTLQPQITHSPILKQVPRYTIVPQHMLPKYLQTPVYRNIGENPHSVENHMQAQPLDEKKLSQNPHSLNEGQYPLPQDHSRPRHKLESTYLSSVPPQHFSEIHRRHPQQKQYSEPSRYIESNDHQRDHSLPSGQIQHQDPQNDPTPTHPVHYRNHQKDYLVPTRYAKSQEPEIGYSAIPTHYVKSREPQQDYSANLHQAQSQDSSLPEKYITERENNQMSTRKRRKKYKPADPDGNIPQTREAKKHRKNSEKDNNDDLHSHSSHQYIIKIG